MNKRIGEDLDMDLHADMLNSFTKFIEHFSPLLDKTEIYHKHLVAENLIAPTDSNIIKMNILSETLDVLNNMVPIFFKIAQLEDRLEKYYSK